MNGGGSVASRLRAVRERMARAAQRAGRDPAGVALIGVCKRKDAALAAEAASSGLADLAENYVQEARDKIPRVRELLEARGLAAPRWHFIGQLQRNKARDVVAGFDVVQSLDRASLGAELERRAALAGRELEVLLQVDLSGGADRGGVAPGDLPKLLEASEAWPHLRVVGLMAIPEAASEPEASRPAFARLRQLAGGLAGARGRPLPELSMGMSADFEIAIEEGATMVRVGTAIFGPR